MSIRTSKLKLTILLLVISGMAAFATESKPLRRMDVPLRFQTLDNLVTHGGLIRLRREYRQEPGRPVVMEAEEATVLEHHSRAHRIMSDPECSGGFYVHHVRAMEYHFEIVESGDYRVRFRAWFPLQANYNHSEQMNDGSRARVVDSLNEEPEQWRWTTGRVYSLTNGMHQYRFPSPTAFCGGARLDKVLLEPVGSAIPEGLGPEPSPFSTPLVGTAETRRINLKRITSWCLDYDIIPNDGTVTVHYRFDHEKEWREVPRIDGDSMLPVPLPKPRYLYFRFKIEGRKNHPSPWIAGLRLRIERES